MSYFQRQKLPYHLGWMQGDEQNSESFVAFLKSLPDSDELSLSDFIRCFWHVVEPGRPYVSGRAIDFMIEHLEAVTRNEIKKLAINVQPGLMKSLLTSVFWQAWEWTQLPWLKYMNTSFNFGLSIRDSVRMRSLIGSTEYQFLYGSTFRIKREQDSKERFDNSKGGSRLVKSILSATGERVDRLVIDDPNNIDLIRSQAHLSAINNAYDFVLSQRSTDKKTWAQVIIQQRVAQNDLSGHVLEENDWVHVRLPARFNPVKVCVTPIGQDWRTKPGEILFPERFSEKDVTDDAERMGKQMASAILDQDPTPQEGNVFNRYWLRFHAPAHLIDSLGPIKDRLPDGTEFEWPVVATPEYFDEEWQFWDTTFKDATSSAYAVGQSWGRKRIDFFLNDQYRRKMGFVEAVDATTEFYFRHPMVSRVLIEDTANGPAIISALSNTIPCIFPWQVKGDKEARANAVAPMARNGHIYLPHPKWQTWVSQDEEGKGGLIGEMMGFPNSAYKDQVDTLTGALMPYINFNPDRQHEASRQS